MMRGDNDPVIEKDETNTNQNENENLLGGEIGSNTHYMMYSQQPHEQILDPGIILHSSRNNSSPIISHTALPNTKTNYSNIHQQSNNIVITSEALTTAPNESKGLQQSFQQFLSLATSSEAPSTSSSFLLADTNKSQTKMDASYIKTHLEYKQKLTQSGLIHAIASALPPEQQQQQQEPPIARFLVTKLRSWRTGYDRILSFHTTYFMTLDPETFSCTNKWFYHQIYNFTCCTSSTNTNEPDCILIDLVGDVKLKFKCLAYCNSRESVITSLAERMYRFSILHTISKQQPQYHLHNSSNDTNRNTINTNPINYHESFQYVQNSKLYPSFINCQRHTRFNQRIPVILLLAPHGILEFHPQTLHLIQTYYYNCIHSVSFTKDDSNGVVLHYGYLGFEAIATTSSSTTTRNNMKFISQKLWYITSRQGRSEFISLLKHQIMNHLGYQLPISSSIDINVFLQGKIQRGDKSIVGDVLSSFPVQKCTKRHHHDNDHRMNSSSTIILKGVSYFVKSRRLIITQNCFLVEYDNDNYVAVNTKDNCVGDSESKVSHISSLNDIMSIVRHNYSSLITNDETTTIASDVEKCITIEYKNGTSSTYLCTDRDVLIAELLDSSINLARNVNIQLTDIPLQTYRMISPFWIDNNETLSTNQHSFSTAKGSTPGFLQLPVGDSVEQQILRRLFDVAVAAESYLNQAFVQSLEENHRTVTDPIQECACVLEICREFNANIMLSRLEYISSDKKVILGAISALWRIVYTLIFYAYDFGSCHLSQMGENSLLLSHREQVNSILNSILQTLYKLMLSRYGYLHSLDDELILKIFNKAFINVDDIFVLYWSLKCISTLLLPRPFSSSREPEQEKLNKTKILCNCGLIVDMITKNLVSESLGQSNVSTLVSMVTSNILESLLCSSNDTTLPAHRELFIKNLVPMYSKIMDLIRSPVSIIAENAILLLYLISDESSESKENVSQLALRSGMLLRNFYNAIFSPLEGQRFRSRYVCSLWMTGSPFSIEKLLLKRMIPPGFLNFLKMPILTPEEEEQLDDLDKSLCEDFLDTSVFVRNSDTAISGRSTNRLRHHIENTRVRNTGDTENFRVLFHVILEDHKLPDLIWNHSTRQDLKKALESELQLIQFEIQKKGENADINWNYQEFSVLYPSLMDEIQVGGVYLRLWLSVGDSFVRCWEEPVRLFDHIYRRFLSELNVNEEVANICIESMDRLYDMHSSTIGVVPDIFILIRSIRYSQSIGTIHRLLSFLATLIGDSGHEGKSKNIICGNAEQLLNEESIDLLVDLVAWGHTDNQVDLSLNHPLSSYENGDNELIQLLHPEVTDIVTPAVWYLKMEECENDGIDTVHRGPFNVQELFNLKRKKTINSDSLVAPYYGSGNHLISLKWQRLETFRQLHWQICIKETSKPKFTPSKVAILAISTLNRLITLYQSIDTSGRPFTPIPRAKQLLSKRFESSEDENCYTNEPLALISQGLLHRNQKIIDGTALLLLQLLKNNDRIIGEFYKTGAFFFICMYEGSEFNNLSKLLKEVHMVQNHKSDDSPQTNSILEYILPKGMIKSLIEHDSDHFADIFVGDIDTPDVIWSPDMRKLMVNHVKKHIGDFPKILTQHNKAKFIYLPIEKVPYPRLEKEIYCHGYYLNNLCDESNFPNYKISNPLAVFEACLQKWNEISTTETMNNENSSNISSSKSENILIYHADEVDVCQSYKNEVQLLMKTLIIIYERYADSVHDYPYSHYNLLISTIRTARIDYDRVDKSHSLLGVSIFMFFLTALRLLFQTIMISSINITRLIEKNGIPLLEGMLDFGIKCLLKYIPDVSNQGNEDVPSMHMDLVELTAKTITRISQFEIGRLSIGDLMQNIRLCENWSRCLSKNFIDRCESWGLKLYVLEGVINLSECSKLRSMLIQTGILWPLFRIMLGYEEIPQDELVENNCNGMKNNAAELSSKALTMLSGVMSEDFSTESNPLVIDAFKTLLTRPIAIKLLENNYSEIPQILSRNTNTPMHMWNMQMRNELLTFIIQLEEEREGKGYQDLATELEPVKSFQYDWLSKEVNIGGVYIRVFNELGCDREVIKTIPDCCEFARALVKFISRSIIQSGTNLDSYLSLNSVDQTLKAGQDSIENIVKENHWCSINDDRFGIAVKSLLSLIRIEGLVDEAMCEDSVPEVLFTLLELPQNTEAFSLGAELLIHLASRTAFADAVSKHGSLLRLLQMLKCDDTSSFDSELKVMIKRQEKGWLVLGSLVSSESIATSLTSSTGWLELMGIVVGVDKENSNRRGAANVFSRLLWDANTFKVVVPALRRILPQPLIMILKDKGPDEFLHSFDQDSETPELIWDNTMRNELCGEIERALKSPYVDDTCTHPSNLSSDHVVKYKRLENEICVGGIYIRLLLSNPGFVLNDPVGLFENVLGIWKQEMNTLVDHDFTSPIKFVGYDTIDTLNQVIQHLCEASYICCKLGEWGYVNLALSYIQKSLDQSLLGHPLEYSVRLLYIASSCISNVEIIANEGGSDNKSSFVYSMMRAIGFDKLHLDCWLMVETLTRIFTQAISHGKGRNDDIPNIDVKLHPNIDALAPSPAPGIEPVRKLKKVSQDHPLAMFFDDPSTNNNESINAIPPRRTNANRMKAVQPKTVMKNTMSRKHQHLNVKASPSESPLMRTNGSNASLCQVDVISCPSIPSQSQPAFNMVNDPKTHLLSVEDNKPKEVVNDVQYDPLTAKYLSEFQPSKQQGYNTERSMMVSPAISSGDLSSSLSKVNIEEDPFSSLVDTNIVQEDSNLLFSTVGDQLVPAPPNEPPPLPPKFLQDESLESSHHETYGHNESATLSVTENHTQYDSAKMASSIHIESNNEDRYPSPENVNFGFFHGRDHLLNSAIELNLVHFLIHSVLENPTLQFVNNPESVKYNVFLLLSTLSLDPRFDSNLKQYPNWQKLWQDVNR